MSDTTMKVAAIAGPVRQQVVNSLREAITSGRFEPGRRLVERDLCELLGVSRPPVREALRQLDAEGLITTVANKGPVVTRLDPHTVRSLYEVRAALEATAAKAFASNASDAQVERLVAQLGTLRTSYAEGDLSDRMSVKNAFYEILMEGGGNDVLPAMFRTINARINVMRKVSLADPGRLPQSLREIERIVEAIRQRDAEQAFRLSLDHVERAAAVVMAAIAEG